MQHKIQNGVALVTRDDFERVLLTKRADEPFRGWWHMPGGGVEFGENLADALTREIREELKVEIHITCPRPVYVTESIIASMGRHVIMHYFQADITKGTPQCGDGTAQIMYVTRRDIRGLWVLETCRSFMRDRLGWDAR